ncbi:MAG: hypothetical protein H7144_13370, partial [Burkholderiales bacterium]|nr:hypothetical protein [Phycisphaerae bacterium]
MIRPNLNVRAAIQLAAVVTAAGLLFFTLRPLLAGQLTGTTITAIQLALISIISGLLVIWFAYRKPEGSGEAPGGVDRRSMFVATTTTLMLGIGLSGLAYYEIQCEIVAESRARFDRAAER